MSLYTRLIGLESPKIAVHSFYSIAHEYKRGQITANQARTFLGLTNGEAQEANVILTKVGNNDLTAEEVHQVLMIAERQNGLYDTEESLKARLGTT